MGEQNKSGYEIRLEIITLAKELAVDKFHTEREPLYNLYLQQLESLKKDVELKYIEVKLKEKLEELPKYPTSKEILELAHELYQFVLKQN